MCRLIPGVDIEGIVPHMCRDYMRTVFETSAESGFNQWLDGLDNEDRGVDFDFKLDSAEVSRASI